MKLRIATFNVENLDGDSVDDTGALRRPTLEERVAVLRPQLERIDADVLCLQEVNGQRPEGSDDFELLALKELIKGTAYESYQLAHSTREDNNLSGVQNLVIMSRFPITSSAEIKHDFVPERDYSPITAIPEGKTINIKFDRSILHAEINIEGSTYHVLTVHLKSKIPTKIPGQYTGKPLYQYTSAQGYAEGAFVSSMKRMGQAFEARMLIDSILDTNENANIVICGDFNAEPGEVPIEVMIGSVANTNNPDLSFRQLFPSSHSLPEDRRFTLYHHGKGNLLDHMLFSRSMLRHYKATEIFNEELNDESLPFRFDNKFIESDHAPFVVTFDVPDSGIA